MITDNYYETLYWDMISYNEVIDNFITKGGI